MPIIGWDQIGAGLNNFGTNAHGHIFAANTYTAIAGDFVDEFFAYGLGQPLGTIHFSIYEFAAGLPTDKVNAEIPLVLPMPLPAWVSVATNIPLTAGVTYTLCARGDPAPLIATTAMGPDWESRNNSGTLPDPWISDSTNFFGRSYYANVANGPPPPTSRIIFPCRAQLIT